MSTKFYRDGLELDVDAKPKVLVTAEGHVVERYSVQGKKGYFVTLAGTHWCAHGATLAQAIADAIWKDPKRRPSLESLRDEIKHGGIERKVSLPEFRLLTGACSAGCAAALSKAGLDGSPMTAKEIKNWFPEWGQKLVSVLGWEKLLCK